MLVITRQFQEVIQIGDDIFVTVVRIGGDKGRLGIEAPRDIAVDRKEIADAKRRDAGRGK